MTQVTIHGGEREKERGEEREKEGTDNNNNTKEKIGKLGCSHGSRLLFCFFLLLPNTYVHFKWISFLFKDCRPCLVSQIVWPSFFSHIL